MNSFFKPFQADILNYKNELDKHNNVFDKTNQMFLDLNLTILDFLGSEDADKLDEWFDYNIVTMGNEFIKIIKDQNTSEKAEGIQLMFFLRLAEEMQVKYGTIENKDLEKLHEIMTSKDFKYPRYINEQKDFALDYMIEIIKRRESLK